MTVLDDQIQTMPPPAGAEKPPRSNAAVLPAGLFVILCVELLAMSLVLGAYVVLWDAWDVRWAAAPRAGEIPWGLLSGMSLLLGSVGISLGRRHLSTGRVIVGAVLIGLTLMYGVLLLGGRMAETRSRWEMPLVYVEQQGAETRPALPGASPLPDAAQQPAETLANESVLGRVELGRDLFMSSCLACHGPAGEGMAGSAPPFSDTGFIFSASDAELVRVIRDGRPANDPASISGRAMPARGGNPFLGDQEINDIAAFVRTLADQDGESDAARGGPLDGGADALAMLPRWVVPPGAPQPPGVEESIIGHWHGPSFFVEDDAVLAERVRFSEILVRSALGVHSLHVLIGMMLLGVLLWRSAMGRGQWAVGSGQDSGASGEWENHQSPTTTHHSPSELNPEPRTLNPLMRWTCTWWHIGTAAWLVLFPVFYLLG